VKVILVAFVVCGTCSTVLGKLLFQCTAEGSDGSIHNFQKPLFQNTGMFTGMSLCLLVFFIQQRLVSTKATLEERRSLLSDADEHAAAKQKKNYRVYYVVLVPAICDFVATYMMNIGLLWINASVWQMIRGSIVFFVALIRWFWLKKPIHNYQWFGVFVVMSALCIIGFSCIMGGKDDLDDMVSPYQKIGGVLLVFLAQLVQATQCVVEEHLLHDLDATDMQIVGLEGIWGLILCVLIAMPIAAYTSVAGLYEDTWDTLHMLKSSPQIMVLYTFYVLVILGYNTFAMKITLYLDSVRRNVLDTLRTMFIWMTLTIIHYTYSTTYGEEWTSWSSVQLFGFGVLIMGLFTYYHVVTWPCFEYPSTEGPELEEAPARIGTPLKKPYSPFLQGGVPSSPRI